MITTKKISKQITLGIDPYTGVRIRKRIYATSAVGLRQAEKDANHEFARHGNISRMKFGTYADRWFAAYCENLTPNTVKTYKSILKHFDKFRNVQMSKIIRPDIQALINDNWSHPYACDYMAFMANAIWRSAVFDGVVDKNIAAELKTPPKPKSERRALTEKELTGVKNADLNVMERFLVDVLQQFGLRPGEAFALNRNSFNRKNKTLSITKSLTHKGEKPLLKPTKTYVNRTLPVPDEFFAKIPKINRLYFFAHEDGSLLTRYQISVFTKNILDKINIAMGGTDQIRVTKMTFYYFRHEKATKLYYLKGVSTKAKAAYMGHSELEFIKRYSHLDESKEETELLRAVVS